MRTFKVFVNMRSETGRKCWQIVRAHNVAISVSRKTLALLNKKREVVATVTYIHGIEKVEKVEKVEKSI